MDTAQIKAFIENKEMFAAVRDYLTDLPRPKREEAEDVCSYGARVAAFDAYELALRKRFGDMFHDAQ